MSPQVRGEMREPPTPLALGPTGDEMDAPRRGRFRRSLALSLLLHGVAVGALLKFALFDAGTVDDPFAAAPVNIVAETPPPEPLPELPQARAIVEAAPASAAGAPLAVLSSDRDVEAVVAPDTVAVDAGASEALEAGTVPVTAPYSEPAAVDIAPVAADTAPVREVAGAVAVADRGEFAPVSDITAVAFDGVQEPAGGADVPVAPARLEEVSPSARLVHASVAAVEVIDPELREAKPSPVEPPVAAVAAFAAAIQPARAAPSAAIGAAADAVTEDVVVAVEEMTDEPATAEPGAPAAAAAPAPAEAKPAARPPQAVPAGGGRSAAAIENIAAAYAARLAAHLRRYSGRLTAIAGFPRSAVVVFTIDAYGSASEIWLFKGTGNAGMDAAALAAIGRASPFPPIPRQLGSSFVVRAPIRFR